jgi:hypothetical protein
MPDTLTCSKATRAAGDGYASDNLVTAALYNVMSRQANEREIQ